VLEAVGVGSLILPRRDLTMAASTTRLTSAALCGSAIVLS
jgi:hypothetical protein